MLALQRLARACADWEGVAEDRLHTTDSCDTEVGNDWTADEAHDIVDKFGINPLAVGRLAVFQPRHTASVSVACLASLESFECRAIRGLGTDCDYAHGIVSFLGWLV